jgi:hypothetical protein
LSEEQHLARSKLWELGVIGPWYLRPSQLEVYDLLRRERYPFVQAARRFGKTNSILAFVLEQLRINPGWICRWCFPFKNQAREVLTAEIVKVQRDCPLALRFNYQVTDSVFIGPNGSKLFIRGVNEDKGESARGPASNIIVCDEYGFWSDPNYIVKEVLFPQLENQEGRILIKASTPPRNLGHLYYKEREVAKRKKRFVSKTIYDNEALSQEELADIIDECGGVESPSFRRERLCEDIGDPTMLVIPEFGDGSQVRVPNDLPRPQFFDAYVAGDNGVDDNAAFLFGYYDFENNKIIIEEEYVASGETTKTKVDVCKDIEKQIWSGRSPYYRRIDADKQTLTDMIADHDFVAALPEKSDKVAAINALRTGISRGEVKIKERCSNLLNQLKVGNWSDEKRTSFERTEGLGHLDAIDALIYFYRSIDKTKNPIPPNHGLSVFSHFTGDPNQHTQNELMNIIRPMRRT